MGAITYLISNSDLVKSKDPVSLYIFPQLNTH